LWLVLTGFPFWYLQTFLRNLNLYTLMILEILYVNLRW